jgi:hypothetical protein
MAGRQEAAAGRLAAVAHVAATLLKEAAVEHDVFAFTHSFLVGRCLGSWSPGGACAHGGLLSGAQGPRGLWGARYQPGMNG